MVDVDLTDAIMFLESGKGIVVDFVDIATHRYDDRQCWPDIQHLSRRRSTCAEKLEVQAAWCCKHDGSPPPAHVYKGLPFTVVKPAHVEGKYFKEDLFRKHLDCNLAYVAMINSPCGAEQKICSTSILSG